MPQIDTDELNAVTEKIIGCVFAVHNDLGSGFLEKAYGWASLAELKRFAEFFYLEFSLLSISKN